jgi:hypothetical protein
LLFAGATPVCTGFGFGHLARFSGRLPATLDYITFYKIKSSNTLGIRLDIVFSVYGVFAVAIIIQYAVRAWKLFNGVSPHDLEGEAKQ